MFEFAVGIARALLFNRIKLMSKVFRLGFNHGNRLAINKQQIIYRTAVGRIFTHCHTQTAVAIKVLHRLYRPARLLQFLVDDVTGLLLGMLVVGCLLSHILSGWRGHFSKI